MTFKTRKPLLFAAAGLLVFASAACQTTLTLNDDQLEQTITQQFYEQTNVALAEIDCPSDRPLQQGDTFTCSATTELDESLTLNVTQTDGQGRVNWSVASE
jgi:hypothetical protein